MTQSLQAPLAILGRLCLVAIFALSAVSNKIPNFNKVAEEDGVGRRTHSYGRAR